jgi:hypothetical protein
MKKVAFASFFFNVSRIRFVTGGYGPSSNVNATIFGESSESVGAIVKVGSGDIVTVGAAIGVTVSVTIGVTVGDIVGVTVVVDVGDIVVVICVLESPILGDVSS